MEKGGCEDLGIGDIHFFGKDLGHGAGMEDVGVPGPSPLIGMGFNCKIKRFPEDGFTRFIGDQCPHLVAVEFKIKRNTTHDPPICW